MKKKISIFKCALLALYMLNCALLVWGIMSFWNVITNNGFTVGGEIASWNFFKVMLEIIKI